MSSVDPNFISPKYQKYFANILQKFSMTCSLSLLVFFLELLVILVSMNIFLGQSNLVHILSFSQCIINIFL